jgi:hypothetical protein
MAASIAIKSKPLRVHKEVLWCRALAVINVSKPESALIYFSDNLNAILASWF